MSFAMQLSQLFDSKLRSARKSARLRLRETKKLLRRARRGLSAEGRTQVETASRALEASLLEADPGAIERACERLATSADKYLATYRKPAWRESVEGIGIAVLVALTLRAFVLEAFQIPSGSMIPTLAIGDQIFVNKYIYGVRVPFTSIRIVNFGMPKRGEVVVFRQPNPPHEDYIKRVVGLPGDEIAVRSGVLYVNGEPVKRRFAGRTQHIDRETSTGRWYQFEASEYAETIDGHDYTAIYDADDRQTAADFGPIVVPDGQVFMMGDNRDHSYDSRAWGSVPLSNILGRSLFIWWSWGRDGFNWKRLGTWVK